MVSYFCYSSYSTLVSFTYTLFFRKSFNTPLKVNLRTTRILLFYEKLARPGPATCANLVLLTTHGIWVTDGPRHWIQASKQPHVVTALAPSQQ
jgi:hypothetical protein